MADYEGAEIMARLRHVGAGQASTAGQAATGLARWIALARRYPWFTAVVAVPSLAAILYYGLIASDIYVSEARYVVRSVNDAQPTALGSILQNAGLVSSQGDAYSVHDFILSRDMVSRLAQKNDLRAILSRPEGDFLTRYPPPFTRPSFEQLFETYQNFVSVTVDETTGISTLRVRAYRPADARVLAAAILNYSENLINRLNDRARHDAVDIAKQEVASYEKRVADAQAAITAYRLRNQMLDPQHTSSAVLDLVAKLSDELADSEAQLSELTRSSPNSPRIAPMRQHIAALNGQIAAEQSKVVGANGSVALTMSAYDRLLLEREFADKGLLSAITSLEAARLEAERKQLYLDRVVEANLPDYPIYPRRLIAILEIILSVLMIYGIGWLVSASVREHVGR